MGLTDVAQVIMEAQVARFSLAASSTPSTQSVWIHFLEEKPRLGLCPVLADDDDMLASSCYADGRKVA